MRGDVPARKVPQPSMLSVLPWNRSADDTLCARAIESHVSPSCDVYCVPDTQTGRGLAARPVPFGRP